MQNLEYFQDILRTNIKRIMKSLDLNQTKLASQMGISQGNLNDIIKSGNPKYETLIKLSEALSVQPYELLLPADKRESLESKDKVISDYLNEIQKLKS